MIQPIPDIFNAKYEQVHKKRAGALHVVAILQPSGIGCDLFRRILAGAVALFSFPGRTCSALTIFIHKFNRIDGNGPGQIRVTFVKS